MSLSWLNPSASEVEEAELHQSHIFLCAEPGCGLAGGTEPREGALIPSYSAIEGEKTKLQLTFPLPQVCGKSKTANELWHNNPKLVMKELASTSVVECSYFV